MIVVGERCDGDGGGSGGGGGVIGKVNFKTPMPPPPPPPPPLPPPLPPPPPPLPVEASLHTGVFRQHRWSFSSLLLKYSYSLSLSLSLVLWPFLLVSLRKPLPKRPVLDGCQKTSGAAPEIRNRTLNPHKIEFKSFPPPPSFLQQHYHHTRFDEMAAKRGEGQKRNNDNNI